MDILITYFVNFQLGSSVLTDRIDRDCCFVPADNFY